MKSLYPILLVEEVPCSKLIGTSVALDCFVQFPSLTSPLNLIMICSRESPDLQKHFLVSYSGLLVESLERSVSMSAFCFGKCRIHPRDRKQYIFKKLDPRINFNNLSVGRLVQWKVSPPPSRVLIFERSIAVLM